MKTSGFSVVKFMFFCGEFGQRHILGSIFLEFYKF